MELLIFATLMFLGFTIFYRMLIWKGLKISLTLHPSYEFTMLIRGYGSGVKVLKPKWLADEIKEDAGKVVK